MRDRLDVILSPVAEQLDALPAALAAAAESGDAAMTEAMTVAVSGAGKRMRPSLVLLVCALGEVSADRALRLAVAFEIIHAATLVHDDVIDHSATRRGAPSLLGLHGEAAAILVGDHCLSRGYQLLGELGDSRLLVEATGAVLTICRGELRQQDHRFDLARTVPEYLAVVSAKTAALLESCCRCAAWLAHLDDTAADAVCRYGRALGIAFQMADDLLDYSGTSAGLGKPAGADLAEGNVTLPLILAMDEHGVRRAIRQYRRSLDATGLAAVVATVRASDAMSQAAAMAQRYVVDACQALSPLPEGAVRTALTELADFVIERQR